MAAEMVPNRVHEIVAEVVAKMPADDLVRWVRYCAEHGAHITLRRDGELVEILVGGAPLVLVPERILSDPDVTTFSVFGALPTIPDDASTLTEPRPGGRADDG